MPIPEIRTSFKKLKGVADVQIEETRVLVTFIDSPEDTLSFPITDETVRVDVSNIQDGRMYAEVSGNKSKLWTLRPHAGTFYVRLDRFVAPEGKLPSPRRYEGTGTKKDGTTYPYDYEAFMPLLRVEGGAWDGTIYPAFLRYLFADVGDGQTVGIKSGSKYAELLAQFLECAGLDFDSDTIPMSENVLPWLEKTLKDRDRKFMMVTENGYVAAFAPLPVGV